MSNLSDGEPEIFSPEDEQDDEPYSPDYNVDEREVFTTPADPDVETLLKRIEDKNLVLRPDFQRTSVWDRTRQSKLIESLLLNLPIPPCFVAEDDDGTRVVVDGQQRLAAIDDFYHGRYPLQGLQVLKDLNGKKWNDLPAKLDRKILQRVMRLLVILRQSNQGIRFEIFERLNTGGEPLTEQEIRNATMRGSFNKMLDKLARNRDFLDAVGVDAPDPRLRHHELILRFFAVRNAVSDYKPPLKMILTEYMRKNRELRQDEILPLESLFESTLQMCIEAFRPNVFRKYRQKGESDPQYEKAISKAVFELQMVSFSFLTRSSVSQKSASIREAFELLSMSDPEFNESLTRATDHRRRFYQRLRLWTNRLKDIGLATELNVILAKVPN